MSQREGGNAASAMACNGEAEEDHANESLGYTLRLGLLCVVGSGGRGSTRNESPASE